MKKFYEKMSVTPLGVDLETSSLQTNSRPIEKSLTVTPFKDGNQAWHDDNPSAAATDDPFNVTFD